jgi:hypothetical protein
MKKYLDEIVVICLIIGVMGLAVSLASTKPDTPEAIVREVVRAESVFVTDTVVLRKVLTRWDTVRTRDTITVDSIVYVPLRIVDSIVAACRPLPNSCERLVTAVRDSAAKAGTRAWQSAGIAWPLGAYYERDLARYRAGSTIGLDREGRWRGEIRFGVRWD